jgi:penicillin amidase
MRRMAELLDHGRVGTAEVEALQRDVLVRPALDLRDHLLALAGGGGAVDSALKDWDGRYDVDSLGASAFELLLYHLLRLIEGKRLARRLAASWDPAGIVRTHLAALPPDQAVAAVRRALAKAAHSFGRGKRWGDLHRLRLPHALGHLPVVGRLFTWGDLPWPGGNETLMKAAHGISAGRRPVRYGADARFIADLSDPDGTRAVLLGGQDGWLGSDAFLDQVEVWRRGQYIPLPLRAERVRRECPFRTVLRP